MIADIALAIGAIAAMVVFALAYYGRWVLALCVLPIAAAGVAIAHCA